MIKSGMFVGDFCGRDDYYVIDDDNEFRIAAAGSV